MFVGAIRIGERADEASRGIRGGRGTGPRSHPVGGTQCVLQPGDGLGSRAGAILLMLIATLLHINAFGVSRSWRSYRRPPRARYTAPSCGRAKTPGGQRTRRMNIVTGDCTRPPDRPANGLGTARVRRGARARSPAVISHVCSSAGPRIRHGRQSDPVGVLVIPLDGAVTGLRPR